MGARIGTAPPFVVPLAAESDWMLSYYALDGAGAAHFGVEALNLPNSEHSVKLKLPDNAPYPKLGNGSLRPSDVAREILGEAIRRALDRLRRERRISHIPAQVGIYANLGCTPKFSLDDRELLRRIGQDAGMDLTLGRLIEEPVAALFQLVGSAALPEGRLMVIDIGGGTLDIAVARVAAGSDAVELYATGGYQLGGDEFTLLIANHLRAIVRERLGEAIDLTEADDRLIRSRAEDAKIRLSASNRVTVALGGIASIGAEATAEIDTAWFRKAAARLLAEIRHAVNEVYRTARLVLDRTDDRYPGTVDIVARNGWTQRLTMLSVEDDGREHLDAVVLVGGAARMPLVVDEAHRAVRRSPRAAGFPQCRSG